MNQETAKPQEGENSAAQSPVASEQPPPIQIVKKEEKPPTVNPSEVLDDDDGDDEDKPEQPQSRQDLFVCFTSEKDLRHHETISIKASLYKGIAVRVKILNHIQTENVLFAIEAAKDHGIVNLRFEECRLMRKGVLRLIEFCKTTSIIESLGIIKVSFEDSQDFKRLVEAVSFNHKIRHFSVQGSEFDEDFHGKTMARCILESRSLKELDLSNVSFDDPKSFYEMANGLLNEKCRLSALKLRGIAFGQLEGKVTQFILMRNRSLQTLDLSHCSTDSPENLENVFCKFDQFCNVRTLVAENLNADFNYIIEIFGEALGVNTKLEGLNLKENKLKQTQYCNFWELMSENKSLRKINIAKTEITDKVCQKISVYLQKNDIRLQDLNLSRNQIAADGLIALAEALRINRSLTALNLAQNFIREGGIAEFVEALRINTSLQELCLSFNKINNPGLSTLSGFLKENSAVKVLDISRNTFSDTGFIDFAKGLALNKGIESLNISKNKDVSDEFGLRELAMALATNSSLAIIDISGLKVRKPCVIQYFQPALKSNITLKRIIGKIPPGIIHEDLKDNVTIEGDIASRFKTLKRDARRELSKLPLHRIDVDQTQLNLKDQRNELLTPALKFIRYRQIHAVDLSNMQLEDESLRLLSLYIEENPVLRSMQIADNLFTDDGLAQLIHALKTNTHLNHINIQGCTSITDQSLRGLEDMVTEVNMSLYAVEIDTIGFDKELVASILSQASMNRAIQEHLKPKKVVMGSLVEIQFNHKANVAQHFDSAIKAWRIMGPSFIRAVNQGLGDDHVEKLCDFLSGRNLIQSLNLRRNKIGDSGAIAISNYVRKADKTLSSLELERNEINDEGGEALLKAMQCNMRMECCKLAYGNPLRQKICRQIEREIKANLQIKATVVPAYKANGNSLDHYEESDRGPDFVRCALKSCELFKILHLSLPDNMIGEREMQDIAYVLSRNTPLRTLNLSDNVVDPSAALVLAQSLASNSHLREIDLRNNKLKNAGIAVLLEPFILQGIHKTRTKLLTETEESPAPATNAKADDKEKEGGQASSSRKSKPKKKYKMKMKRLLLKNNCQGDEALKHVYATILGNEDIDIDIDLPLSRMKQEEEEQSSRSSIYSEEDDEDMEGSLGNLGSPRNAIVPMADKKKNGEDNESHPNSVNHNALSEENEDNENEPLDSGVKKKREKPPGICRLSFCRPCRHFCYRDPNKKRESCTDILCGCFLKHRRESIKFKISWNYITESENSAQTRNFVILICFWIFYAIVAIIMPIQSAFAEEEILPWTEDPPIQHYTFYSVFAFLSTLFEVHMIQSVFRMLNKDQKDEEKHTSCNRYLLAKWFVGQISHLSLYVQVLFLSSQIFMLRFYSGDMKFFEKLLVVCFILMAIFFIIMGNSIRLSYMWKNLFLQDQVHKIFPRGFRNSQVALILNMQAIAVVLESTSLSEYIIEMGGPVMQGKKKFTTAIQPSNMLIPPPLKPTDKLKPITNELCQLKYKWQERPMFCLIFIYWILGNNGMVPHLNFSTIIGYLLVTLLSMYFQSLALQWKREPYQLDLTTIVTAIQERKKDLEKKAEEAATANEVKKSGLKKKAEGSDTSDTLRSDDSGYTSGINDVIQELEWLERGERNKGGNLASMSLHDSSKAPFLGLSGSDQYLHQGDVGGDTIIPHDLAPVDSLPQDFASGGADIISTPPKILSTDQDVQQPGFSRNNSAEATGFKQITAEKVNNLDGLDVSISKQDVKQ